MENLTPKDLPTNFYTPKSFFSLNGAAVAVWIFCLVVGSIFPPRSITPIQYRIIAITLSEIIALIIVFRSRNRKLEYWFLAIFNGILIFVNASGWNVITSNSFFSDRSDSTPKPPSKAALLNIPQIHWWESNSLFVENRHLQQKYDSLVNVTYVYKEKVKEYIDLTDDNTPITKRSEFIIDSLKRELLKVDSYKTQYSRMKEPTFTGGCLFLEKMNVLYIGVENPVTVFPALDSQNIAITFSSGSASYIGPGKYIVTPRSPGLDTLRIVNNRQVSYYPVRIKYLPEPVAFVGGKKGGVISSAELKAYGGLMAGLEYTDFQATYKVLSYKVGASGGPIINYVEAPNAGARWSGAAATIIRQVGPGSQVYFDEIKALAPDGRTINLSPIIFFLR